MQWVQATRGDVAERAITAFTNVDQDSITTGYAVAVAIAGNSFTGFNVVKPASGTAGNLPGVVGIALNDAAFKGVVTVCTWGFVASVFLSRELTSTTINQGNPLVPGLVAGGLWSVAPTYANSGFRYVLASNTPVSTSLTAVNSYCSGFVRCL